jgi:uncharacterized membrane protein YgdD (TMEM256/DUF423 family)
MRPIWLLAAGINGLGAITAGALAQHLWAGDPHRLMLAEIGIRYGLPHAAALLAVAALAQWVGRRLERLLSAAGAALALGTTLFCFSLYALAAGAPEFIAALTPVGGTLMILGWALLIVYAVALSRSGSRSDGLRP